MAAPSPNLVFAQARLAGAPAHLVFGDDGTGVTAPVVTIDIAATLASGLTVEALVLQPVRAEVTVLLAGTVTVSAAVYYDNRVTPWRDCRAAAPQNPGVPLYPQNAGAWGISESKRGARVAAWTQADPSHAEPRAPAGTCLPKRHGVTPLWQLAIQKAQASAAAHQKAVAKFEGHTTLWQLGDARLAESASGMQAGIFRVLDRAEHWQRATPARGLFAGPIGASMRYAGVQSSDLPWQMAGGPLPGLSTVTPEVPEPPTFYWDAKLVFECPALLTPALVFGAQACYLVPALDATFYILPARCYMTTHNVFAQRLPDLADIPIYEATVAADAGSYCWTLSASGPASLFDLLAPTNGLPVQLRVTLDGIAFVFAVDSLSRSGSFGKTGINVSGRSVTALIGAPYLRATTRDNAAGALLAQQLALAALGATGVDLDWGLADWLVPAGAWSHQGTPLDAVQAIAQAAGGYLQSHRSAATLLARHPYSQRAGDQPGAPWGWMTGAADVELAPDAIITEGLERKDGADLNAVYVSGTTQGVLGLVKRTGSAGDKLGAMVTDPLITHVAAARQRGLAVLGAAGAKYNVRLELPVLTGAGQPGVLDVGQLVQINAAQPWRGRVRAVSVNANRPSLRQTVTLERHLEAV